MNNRTLLCVYHRVNVFKSTPSQSSRFDNDVLTKRYTTRIHSSRMRTVRCSSSLLPRTPPCHSCPLRCMPPTTHAPPQDACPLPCVPPCHTHPPTMHTPLPHMPSLPHITFTQLLNCLHWPNPVCWTLLCTILNSYLQLQIQYLSND